MMPIIDPYDEKTKIVDPFDSPEYQKKKKKMQDVAATGSMLRETLANYPSSAGRLIKGAATGAYDIGKQVVTAPMETLGNVMQTGAENVVFPVLGLAQKVNPSAGLGEAFIPDYERVRSAITEGPYGSMENYMEYVKKDPAQAQADIAMALTGGGKLIETAGGLTKLGQIGKGIKRAGGIIEPLTAPAKITGTLIGKITPSRILQKFYASSSKMITTMDPVERNKLAQKLMDADVRLSIKGFQRLHDQFEALWKNVDKLIDEYIAKGANEKKTVFDLVKGLDDFADEAALTGNKRDVLRIKNKMISDLTDNIGTKNNPIRVPRQLNAKEINRAKRNFYKQLNSMYGKSMKPIAAQAKMQIASNARKLIEEMVPGVAQNNATAKAYKELMDAIERGVNRIENRDLLSIGLPLKAGAGAVIAEGAGLQQLGGMLGLMVATFDLPSVKSRFALMLNKIKRNGVKVRPAATLIKVGLAKKAQFEEKKRNPVYPEGWTIRK